MHVKHNQFILPILHYSGYAQFPAKEHMMESRKEEYILNCQHGNICLGLSNP